MDLATVEILDGGDGNTCFARLPDGMGVFVAGPIVPGDTVLIGIIKRHARHAEARFLKLKEPSPLRTEPRCPHFGTCGGCKWQSITPAAEADLKTRMVRDTLERIGRLPDPPLQPLIHGEPFAYRNKITLHYHIIDGLLHSGFRPARSHELQPIETCHITSAALNDLQQRFLVACREHRHNPREAVFRETQSGQTTITLKPKTLDHLPDAIRDTFPINDILHDELAGCRFDIAPTAFFQVNHEMAERLVTELLRLVNPAPADTAVDLFCGCGTLTLPFARKLDRIIGIEGHAPSVQQAIQNAALNDIENATFLHQDLADPKRGKRAKPFEWFVEPDLILVDPPRAGLGQRLIKAIRKSNAHTLAYVSCNPATFARDTARLLEDDRFELIEVVPIDLFPQTNHVEVIGLFRSA